MAIKQTRKMCERKGGRETSSIISKSANDASPHNVDFLFLGAVGHVQHSLQTSNTSTGRSLALSSLGNVLPEECHWIVKLVAWKPSLLEKSCSALPCGSLYLHVKIILFSPFDLDIAVVLRIHANSMVASLNKTASSHTICGNITPNSYLFTMKKQPYGVVLPRELEQLMELIAVITAMYWMSWMSSRTSNLQYVEYWY